jgi:hypothetical protein
MTSSDIIHRILNAHRFDEPFWHLRFENFFPAGELAQMRALLPPLRVCHELKHPDAKRSDGTYSRLEFSFKDHEFQGMSDEFTAFWRGLQQAITSEEVTHAVAHQLRPGLKRRFGNEWADVGLRPSLFLLRDQGGYRIDIHPDHLGKVITLQIYLPPDGSLREAGTVFYKQFRPLTHPLKPGAPVHRDDQDKFDVVHRMPFVPGSGYAFVVDHDTMHGVDSVQAGAGRDSIMLHYHAIRS